MTLRLAEIGYHVTGLDPSESLIAAAKARIMPAGYSVDLLVGDALDAPKLGEFEVILCLDVLEHIESDGEALEALREALIPGGIGIFSVPAISALFGERDHAIGHYRRYDKADFVRKVARAGLDVLSSRYWNLLGVLPYWFYERVLHKEVYDGLRVGEDSRLRQAARGLLTTWLRVEGNLPLPIGLSLICVAARPATS